MQWNEDLRALHGAERDHEQELPAAQVQHIEELASDFPQVWEAPKTDLVDRERLLDRLSEYATLKRDAYEVALALGSAALPLRRQPQFPLDRRAAA